MCQRLAPAPGRARGVVKWFSRARGYGFITPTEGPELFLHGSGMAAGQPLPRAGQLVEFTRTQGQRGAQAVEVTVLA
jgi:CspA family cold shock protein